jgi:hypothetical protein
MRPSKQREPDSDAAPPSGAGPRGSEGTPRFARRIDCDGPPEGGRAPGRPARGGRRESGADVRAPRLER